MVELTREELKEKIMDVLINGPLKEVEMRIDELVAELIPEDEPIGYVGPVVEE